jgi:replicative DNA helicase
MVATGQVAEAEAPSLAREAEDEKKFNDRRDAWMQRGEEIHNVAEVVIGKQRHGPIGIVKLAFDADTVRFGNLAHGYEEVSYE